MRASAILGTAAIVLSVVGLAVADDLKSGLQPGDQVSAFEVEKIGGAVNDGVNTGEHLCYRCFLGGRPVVMVFAHSTNGALAHLVGELDKALEKHADQKLSSVVILIGDDPEGLKTDGKQFARKYKVERVAMVVPEDHKYGPEEHNINPATEFTVLLYRTGEVVVNHAFKPGELNDKSVQTIIDDTSKILE